MDNDIKFFIIYEIWRKSSFWNFALFNERFFIIIRQNISFREFRFKKLEFLRRSCKLPHCFSFQADIALGQRNIYN